jgi:hypothetical protein
MTPKEAYDYIANALPDFQAKGNTLYQQLHAANILRAQIHQAGDDSTDIDNLYDEILSDVNQWNAIKDKLVPVLSYFGYSGLGEPVTISVVTLAVIGASLIAIVALLIDFYNSNRIAAHANALKVISSKLQLNPDDQAVVDQATSTGLFGSLFSGLGTFGNYLFWGGAIYLGILLLRE